MSVRPPQSFSNPGKGTSALSPLEYELMSERADALGRHGQKVEKAIAAIAHHRDTGGTPEARERLLDEAADVVWAFFIQREVCGLRNSRDAIVRYRIPAEVIARLGIMRKP